MSASIPVFGEREFVERGRVFGLKDWTLFPSALLSLDGLSSSPTLGQTLPRSTSHLGYRFHT